MGRRGFARVEPSSTVDIRIQAGDLERRHLQQHATAHDRMGPVDWEPGQLLSVVTPTRQPRCINNAYPLVTLR